VCRVFHRSELCRFADIFAVLTVTRILAGLVLALAWLSAPAHAVTATLVASGSCTAVATSCTVNVTADVPTGSFLVAIATVQSSLAIAVTFSDNAATPNCGGAYVLAAKPSLNNGTPAVFYCAATTTAMSSGTTCGSGSTQCAFTATTSGSVDWAIQVYAISGIAGFDKAGFPMTGTWTSGAATTFATTPTLGHSSEWALSIVAVGAGAAADTMTSFTGAFSPIGWLAAGATNKPEFFLSAQTLTSGLATSGATPTSSAGRAYNSIVLLFLTTGSSQCGNSGGILLLGLGGGGGACASAGSQFDFSDPSNSALLSAI